MQESDRYFIELVQRGDIHAVSRLITMCENGAPQASAYKAALQGPGTSVHVTGVTGAPGVGKSTLVDGLAYRLTERGTKVGVIAVDPSSPFSGGAMLGDRIRMVRAAESNSIFIRSMATRGALGGIARAVFDAIWILGAAGYQHILVETVGVGQAEVDIVRVADSCLVVLVPGMGDSIQTFKAGVMEIADLFVVNKADREGSERVERDLQQLLGFLETPEGAWRPPIVRSVALTGEGASEILDQVEAHQSWLQSSDLGRKRRLQVLEDTILHLAAADVRSWLLQNKREVLKQLACACAERRLEVHQAAQQLAEITA